MSKASQGHRKRTGMRGTDGRTDRQGVTCNQPPKGGLLITAA